MGRAIVDALCGAAKQFPDTTFTFPCDERSVSNCKLFDRAERVAAGLHRVSRSGQAVGVLMPTSEAAIVAVFGVFLSGFALSALPLPTSLRNREAYVQRLNRILRDGAIDCVLVDPRFRSLAQAACAALPRPISICTLEELPASGHFAMAGSPFALVQYTSGSTSDPKGVALTDGNVLAGLAAIAEGVGLCPDDCNGQWIPLSHDMGLIGMLAGFVSGVRQYLWPASHFVRRPARWLREFAQVGASIYAGPDFSYATLSRVAEELKRGSLDLSRWRVAFNGSEPIDAHTLSEFLGCYADCGFRAQSMYPVYGLAEATLAVTFPTCAADSHVDWVRPETLGPGQISLSSVDAATKRGLVGVGRPVAGMEIRIGVAGQPRAADRVVGQIMVRGASVMPHYFGRTPEDSGIDADGWLDTGDLGYTRNGTLFVCGRSKETTIVNGTNVYLHDLEACVARAAGVEESACIAFVDPSAARQRVILLVEAESESSTVLHSLQSALVGELGTGSHEARLVPRGAIERTGSGKKRRLEAAARFARGVFERPILSVSPTTS